MHKTKVNGGWVVVEFANKGTAPLFHFFDVYSKAEPAARTLTELGTSCLLFRSRLYQPTEEHLKVLEEEARKKLGEKGEGEDEATTESTESKA